MWSNACLDARSSLVPDAYIKFSGKTKYRYNPACFKSDLSDTKDNKPDHDFPNNGASVKMRTRR